MAALQESNWLAPRMMVFITRLEDEKRLETLLEDLHIPILYQCRGKGTAPSEMLDIFGLSGTTRVITVGILPKCMVGDVFEQVGRKLSVHQRGGGIAITIPVTGIQHPILQFLNDEARSAAEQKINETMEGDMVAMQEKSEFTVIWVSVASGFSDDVVDAARSAGAKGGTVLKGRRRNSERLSQHLGISVQEGQEFVMIVAPRAKKSEIMSAICSACGLRTEAHGIVLSLPVDEVMGLEC